VVVVVVMLEGQRKLGMVPRWGRVIAAKVHGRGCAALKHAGAAPRLLFWWSAGLRLANTLCGDWGETYQGNMAFAKGNWAFP
jgi:hypothetical protein